MQVWNKLTTQEILLTLEQELAKAQNELKCAQADVQKAQNRLAFCFTALHDLKARESAKNP